MNNNESHNDPSNTDGRGTDEARNALHRLAARAHTEPTRPLGTYEMVAEPVGVDRREGFEWRRLAVAAAIVALVGGGVVVAVNQGAGDSSIGASPVDPITTSAPAAGDVAVDPSLGAGWTSPGFPSAAGAPIQYQYAVNADRPETGPWVVVTTHGTRGVESWSFTFGAAAPTPEPGATVPPTSDQPEPVDQQSTDFVCDVSAPETGGAAQPPAACSLVNFLTVDGDDVSIVSSGLTDEQATALSAAIVRAPDGFGYHIDPVALPDGFTEIASGARNAIFEPRSAIDETVRVGLVWRPDADPEAANNPVLGSANIDQATVLAVADGGDDLAGQRLGYEEVREASVGDAPAVVQITTSGESEQAMVAVVWRRDGWLYSYMESGAGAQADATLARLNQMLPLIERGVVELYSTTTTLPPDSTMLIWCDDVIDDGTVPPTFTIEWVDGSVPVTGDVPPGPCIPVAPTTEEVSPTTEPDQHSPTTGPGIPTTETTATPDYATTTTAPPYPSDTLDTTTIPGYGGGSTTTYPGQGSQDSWGPVPTTEYFG